jgi:hypothetical protein
MHAKLILPGCKSGRYSRIDQSLLIIHHIHQGLQEPHKYYIVQNVRERASLANPSTRHAFSDLASFRQDCKRRRIDKESLQAFWETTAKDHSCEHDEEKEA